MENMKVLYAASEVVPFAKTGGLADVAGSLPKYLKRIGVDIRVVMPKYGTIPWEYAEKMEYIGNIYVPVGWRSQYCGIFKMEHDGVTIYFVDNEYYFKRDSLYGHYDQAEQFAFFSRAIIEILPVVDFKPDIIHTNDWQTGLVSLLLSAHYKNDEYYRYIKTVFTIHNLKYQGVFGKELMHELIGLSMDHFDVEGIEFYDDVNFLKSGIAYSSVINTVSKTYAEEIKDDFFGESLDGIIKKRSEDIYGIVNGIDYEANDPDTDKRIFKNYNSIKTKEGKAENKRKLQEVLGLPIRDDVPIIGIISRMVDQKGFDLINYVLYDLLKNDVQLVILGTGEYKYEKMFRQAAYNCPAKVSCNTKYDALLAQRIYAGSDMFLMPSLFEPCGLGQLFSLRYGTIPIVRETGGLNDTIQAYNEFTGEGNGFSFYNYNAHDMLYTIGRAIHFYHDKKVWNKLVKRAMKQDFSWEKSAKEYVDLYNKALDKMY